MQSIQVNPIGSIRRDGTLRVELDPQYAPALLALREFSHVIVLWWAQGCDTDKWRQELQIDPPYAPGHRTGIFATRAPHRPNPICLTVCPIVEVDEQRGMVIVSDIDAMEGSPVLDIKAYYPVCDRVRQAHIAPWLQGWPEWMPEAGLSLEVYDEQD